jgi:TRAP-type C4-dicarboxylate transport system permease small subunit
MDAAPTPGRRDAADQILSLLSAQPLGLIVVLTFADVFARYLFSSPIRGSVEIIQFAMALVIFTALPLVTRKREHVTVSLVDGVLRGGAKRVQQVLVDAISVFALGVLTWRLWLQGGDDLAADTRTIVLGMPQAPLTYAMCAFAALATAYMLMLLARQIRGDAGSAA